MTRAHWWAASTVAVVYMGVGAAAGLAASRRVITLAERGVDRVSVFLDRRYEW